MKFIPDHEVDLSSSDLLKTKVYADALEEMILKAPEGNSLTIGLFGEWGSGKSSVIKTALTRLISNKSKKYAVFTYDAWKYSNDSFRRTFLTELSTSLNVKIEEEIKKFYKTSTEDVSVIRKPHLGHGVFALLVIGFIAMLAISTIQKWEPLSIVAFALSFASLLVNLSPRIFPDYKKSEQQPIYFAAEQFEQLFKFIITQAQDGSLLDRGIAKLSGKKHQEYEKIIFVIDNIDRCSKEIAYELVTTIKSFFAAEKSVIFLVPVDDKALIEHLSEGKENLQAEGQEFLRKVFNATLRIKPHKRYDLFDFTQHLNEKYELGLTGTTVDIVAKEYASNPRRIIQFLNNLQSELKVFAAIQGESFVQTYQSLITQSLVIREEWPDYYKVISYAPEKIHQYNPSNETAPPSLIKFLAETKGVFISRSYDELTKVYSTNDRSMSVPQQVDDALRSSKFTTLNEAVKNETIASRDLARIIIERFEISVNRGAWESDAANYFALICLFIDSLLTSIDDRSRIAGIMMDKEQTIYEYAPIDELDPFILTMRDGYSRIEIEFIKFINNSVKHPDSIHKINKGKKMMVNYVHILPEDENLLDFQDSFNQLVTDSRDVFEISELKRSQIVRLINKRLLGVLTGSKEFLSASNNYYKRLRELSMHADFEEDGFIMVVEYAITYFPKPNELSYLQLHEELTRFNDLMENQVRPCPEISERFNGILNILQTVGSGEGENFYNWALRSNNRAEIIRLIILCYVVSNETFNMKPQLPQLMEGSVSDQQGAFALLNYYQHKFQLTMVPAKYSLWASTTYGIDQLQIIRTQFSKSNPYGSEFYGDQDKRSFAEKIILSTQNSDQVALFYIVDLPANDPLKLAIASFLEEQEIAAIKKFPIQLQYLVINKIITHLGGEYNISFHDLLRYAAGRKDFNEIDAMLNMISALVNDVEQTEMGLDLLEEIKEINPEQEENLLTAVAEAPDNIKLQIDNILNRKKMIHDRIAIPEQLTILQAEYFSPRTNVGINFTRNIATLGLSEELRIKVTNELAGGDPDRNYQKRFSIQYCHIGVKYEISGVENETITIPSKFVDLIESE